MYFYVELGKVWFKISAFFTMLEAGNGIFGVCMTG